MHLEPYSEPSTWHPQDWLLIAEALNEWADNRTDSRSYRGLRARELVLRIAEYIDLSELEFEQQRDPRWGAARQKV